MKENKKYKPEPWIPFSRPIEMIIQFPFFFLIILAGDWIKDVERFSLVSDLLIALTLFLAYKFLGTFSSVDLITFDFENKKISIIYWFLNFFKKEITIDFENLTFKNKHNITIIGDYSIYFYENENLKIKLNERNGWKGEQLDEILEDLKSIKEPLKTLVPRTPD